MFTRKRTKMPDDIGMPRQTGIGQGKKDIQPGNSFSTIPGKL
jgi:hypothetical protein